MSSSHQHGAQHPAEEPDPTGVRALLSSLPDPGPMPEHVALRIQQSLEREQRFRREHGAPAATDELLARRRQRQQDRRGIPRWAPWAGAAAAVAAGAMVVSTQFLGGAPMADITASVSSGDREGADSAGEAGAGIEQSDEGLAPMADQGGDDAAGDGEQAEAESAGGEVLELGDRSGDGLEQLLHDWYTAGPGPSPWEAEAGATCADASRLAEPEEGAPAAYPARWQDQEAVLLLLPSAAEADEAWLVETGCLRGRVAEVLHGPVPLP